MRRNLYVDVGYFYQYEINGSSMPQIERTIRKKEHFIPFRQDTAPLARLAT